MKNKNFKKLWAIVLLSSLALTACGNATPTKEETKETTKESTQESADVKEESEEVSSEVEVKEAVTITYFVDADNRLPEEFPWLVQYLEEEVGVKIETSQNFTNSDKADLMIAGGELCDVNDLANDCAKAAAEAGLCLDLSQYKDKLPNVFENELYASGIEYHNSSYDGAVYLLPAGVGDRIGVYGNLFPYVRWDVYKEIGYPEIKTEEDFLDVLEQMVEACPENEYGEKTYATSVYAGHTAGFAYLYSRPLNGRTDDSVGTLGMIDNKGNFQPITEEGGDLYKGIEFMFKLNQRGLLDPDGMVMSSEEYKAKAAAGRYMVTPVGWLSHNAYNTEEHMNAEDWSGYMPIWPEFMTFATNPSFDNGDYRQFCVSADCENLDAVLNYINWLYSVEANDLLYNGPEGVLYTVENGERVPTDLWWEFGTSYEMPEGGTIGGARSVLGYTPISDQQYLEELGGYVGVYNNSAFEDSSTWNKVQQDYAAHYDGYVNLYKRAVETGKQADQLAPIFPGLNTFIWGEEENAQWGSISAAVNNIYMEYIYKMIYAVDRAEFDALFEQMCTKAKEAGGDEFNTWLNDVFCAGAYERATQ